MPDETIRSLAEEIRDLGHLQNPALAIYRLDKTLILAERIIAKLEASRVVHDEHPIYGTPFEVVPRHREVIDPERAE